MNYELLKNILVVVLVVAFIAFLVYKGRKEQAKKIILALVIEAEIKFGAGTGVLKYAYVIGLIYPRLPTVVRLFITEAKLDLLIENAVTYLKLELQPLQIQQL